MTPSELNYRGQRYQRREAAQGTFRITPVRAVEQLRAEALKATPPPQPDTLLKPDLVELHALDPTIRYDIRYATTNNFMGAVFYSQARAFLQRPAADAVVRAHRKLKRARLRPADPRCVSPVVRHEDVLGCDAGQPARFRGGSGEGSRHNRGAAVDLTLYDLKTGELIEMPSGYDEFSDAGVSRISGRHIDGSGGTASCCAA